MANPIDDLKKAFAEAEKHRKDNPSGGLVVAKDGDTPVGFAVSKMMMEAIEYLAQENAALKRQVLSHGRPLE